MAQPVAHDKLPVARDIMFGSNTHFHELLAASIEGIASNILAGRLAKLVDAGLLTPGCFCASPGPLVALIGALPASRSAPCCSYSSCREL